MGALHRCFPPGPDFLLTALALKNWHPLRSVTTFGRTR